MKRLLGPLCVLALALTTAGPALGQARTTGRVLGDVVDESGTPIDGARVSFVSSAMQGERVTRTNASGQFLAELLPVGPYAVTVAAAGKRSAQVSMRVGLGRNEPLRVALAPGEQQVEKITVLAPATPLETTTLGENLSYDTQVEELPIQDRHIDVVAGLAPNVSFSNVVARTSGSSLWLTIAGAAAHDTSILVDGAEISEPRHFFTPQLYLEDAIEEVQVMTAGISARYGRFTGGVVNAITKTGGNSFDGNLRAELRKESWNSQTPIEVEQSDDLEKTYQATLGGYVLKDRLWFFAGGRTGTSKSTAGIARGTGESFVEKESEDRWQIKLRGSPAPDHVIEANYLDLETEVDPVGALINASIFAGDLRATQGSGVFPRDVTTLSYQAVLGPQTFLDFRFSEKNVASIRGGDPALGSPFIDFGTLVTYNNAIWDKNDPIERDNRTLGISLTRVLDSEGRGSHTLETGLQLVESTTAGADHFTTTGFTLLHIGGATPFAEQDPSTGELLFNLNSAFAGGDQINARWVSLPLDGDQELENTALYAQDTWHYGKWRVDLGLRWERYDGSGPQPEFDVDMDELAPRAALTYNPRPDWQVQASWGKYVGRLYDGFVNFATGVGSRPRIQSIYVGPEMLGLDYDGVEALLRDDSVWVLNAISNPATPSAFLADGADLPYANDLNLALKWGLPRNAGSATLTYTNREYKDLLEAFVGGLGVQDVPVPGTTETVTVDTIVWDNAPQARREYEALTATWDYRPSPRWNVGGNWTWSELKGNQEEISSQLDDLGSAIGTYARSRPEAAAVPWGNLEEDVEHRINVWGSYRFDFGRAGGLVLGGLWRYQSGLPWSRTGEVPLTDDPEYVNDSPGSYTHYFDGRGNNSFDGWWSLDASARYRFPIHKRLDGWIKASVVNVFDNDDLITFDTSGSAVDDGSGGLEWVADPGFGAGRGPEDYQVPRSYLLTVGLAF